MPARLSENIYNFYNGILGQWSGTDFYGSYKLLYHKSSRCKPTRRYAVFCRQTKDLMVKCSQRCGAPQAVLLHGKIRSRRILSLRLLYHTSRSAAPPAPKAQAPAPAEKPRAGSRTVLTFPEFMLY